jgi:hypothetical protein
MARLGSENFFSALIRYLSERSPVLKPIVTSKNFFAYFQYFYIKMNRLQGYSYSKYIN